MPEGIVIFSLISPFYHKNLLLEAVRTVDLSRGKGYKWGAKPRTVSNTCRFTSDFGKEISPRRIPIRKLSILLLMVPIVLTLVQLAVRDGVFETPVVKDVEVAAVSGAADAFLDPFFREDLYTIDVDPEADYVLALYRNPLFHQQVRDFFAEETGSLVITDIILEAAAKQRIPVMLAFSLAWGESRFDPEAVNRNSASIDRGLFQLNSRSFPELSESQFFDPKLNAEHGMKYLRYCLDVGDNRVVALAMYNAGRSRVTDRGAPKMTLDYISKILDYQDGIEERFEDLHLRKKSISKDSGKVRYVLDRGSGSK